MRLFLSRFIATASGLSANAPYRANRKPEERLRVTKSPYLCAPKAHEATIRRKAALQQLPDGSPRLCTEIDMYK